MAYNKTYLRSDIYNILLALARNNTRVERISSPETRLYFEGYTAALLAVADAFDIWSLPRGDFEYVIEKEKKTKKRLSHWDDWEDW